MTKKEKMTNEQKRKEEIKKIAKKEKLTARDVKIMLGKKGMDLIKDLPFDPL